MKLRVLLLSILTFIGQVDARIPRGMAIASTASGTWVNVTPAAINLTPNCCSCTSFGIETVGADTAHPGTLYFQAHCQGIYKSTDYGVTWTGPINTGTNGSTVQDCAGGITVVPNGTTPIIWEACIRGAATGVWKSTNGGVDWSSVNVVPPLPSGRPDTYPVVVDPYNVNHVLIAGHEQNYLLQTTDGGSTFTSVTLNAGMLENGGTAFVSFINTGSSSTTANTWLYITQQSGGTYGTWRTANGGSTWTQVDTNEHPHGASQTYQPDNSGVLYMAGYYSALGPGILRSTDYGVTWAHVGANTNETMVYGSAVTVYSLYGWSDSNPVNPDFQSAAQPGTPSSLWGNATGAPTTWTGGPHTMATVNTGSNVVYIGAMGLSGIWRYVE